MRDNLKDIEAAGIQVVGISYDSVDVLRRFSDEEMIPFPLLSDGESQTIKAYELHYKDGLPHPGTVIVDTDGIVRFKLFEEGYRKRHAAEALIEVAKRLSSD